MEKIPKFQHDKLVYIRATGSSAREGPYKIEKIVLGFANTASRFTLCDSQTNVTAKDGREFSATELEGRDAGIERLRNLNSVTAGTV